MNPSFVLGVIAGEGTFNVALHHQEERAKHNVRPDPQFAVKMDVRDKNLVKECHESVGLGQYNEYEDMVYWSISSKEDCKKMVEYVEENANCGFKNTEKWESFKVWRDVVDIVGEPYKRLSEDEVRTCVTKAKEMNTTYTAERTEEEWLSLVGGD
jgi:hypothetical protein